MEKIVSFGNGKNIGLKATARTPRLYRFLIGRDMIVDMNQLKKNFDKVSKKGEDAQLSIADLTIYENAAYIMAKQYDNNLPNSADEWLDSMDEVFTIYELLPHIFELWNLNQATTAIPKKK